MGIHYFNGDGGGKVFSKPQ